MTTGKSLNKYFTKIPTLKKIRNSFGRSFAITKTKEPCMIAGILLMNQKQFIADLETQTPNSESKSRT